ncbi:UNVERIFIED_CONTAM: Glyoxylate/hydroxypyruvate reductase HPR3 [Sesamum angustifolium]|uniref:Glyoxylate/hydroxypyruvate reductase HPR3 n=1 Tax=Sesamum angustifolium TaxID=2727405 RepID=A0AAW2N912_9LAMI
MGVAALPASIPHRRGPEHAGGPHLRWHPTHFRCAPPSPSLRLVVTTSAGINHIDLVECRRRGIAVANAAGIFSADVADLAVGLLLDVLRRISAGNRFVKGGLWPMQEAYPLGFKQRGLKHSAVQYRITQRKSVSYAFCPDICKLAANSDILVICCALTEQTHHMINREVLLALGKEGALVNIARGAVVDEKELVSCLQSGEIGGAGLDVFENEPSVPKELHELNNVVMSPHCAAFTEVSMRDLYELMCANLEAFFSNKPLLSLIQEE